MPSAQLPEQQSSLSVHAAPGAPQAHFPSGCATCHAGPHYTNNTTVDVGTHGEFQVPSLLGVVWRAPYLHDGCAPTLRDRFGSCGGGDRHGHTSDLTAGEIDDLIAFLSTL